ncbi:hypothetical protein [Acidithiobacillus sulfurivorans]|uniref:Uncharacterized protein n=1 Tax=Acidithiobacillus sulfurivorans TaxID=1958756 RepID=A0ABS5ZZV0_9PROT|nr:hypothetical protein [Acidithiobacillus sulfurivorans]MBU2760757.1 hypothetical protein [Acidithiobacillus sulfurivorans]
MPGFAKTKKHRNSGTQNHHIVAASDLSFIHWLFGAAVLAAYYAMNPFLLPPRSAGYGIAFQYGAVLSEKFHERLGSSTN